jgi:uncharacterized membrane protein YbhN (UPF0104 family)
MPLAAPGPTPAEPRPVSSGNGGGPLPAPTRRRGPWRLLLAAAFVVALVWTVSSLGPDLVFAVVRRADPLWLGLSILPLLLRFGLWAFKWRRILTRQAPVPFAVALRNVGAGAFVNLTTPTAKLGGAVARSIFMDRRFGWGLVASYGRTLSDQLTNTIGSLLLFGVVALSTVAAFPGLDERGPLAVSGGLATLLVLAAIVARRPVWARLQRPGFRAFVGRWTPRRLSGWATRGRGADGLLRLLYPLLGEGNSWRTFFPDLVLGGAAFGSLALSNALVLRALGVDTDLRLVATAVILGYFGGSVVGAWGGIGVTEMMLTGLYVRAGIPPDAALAGALLHRAGFYLVVIALGGPSLFLEARDATRPRPESGPPA